MHMTGFQVLKKNVSLDIPVQDSVKETKRLIWGTGEGGESRTFTQNAIELRVLGSSASNLGRFILSPKEELATTWHYPSSQRASCLTYNLYNKQRVVTFRTYVLQQYTLKNPLLFISRRCLSLLFHHFHHLCSLHRKTSCMF